MDDDANEFDWFFRIMPIGVVIVLVYALWAAPEPKPPPENSAVFGCYLADDAPPILLNEEGMQIMQEGFLRIGYHLVSRRGLKLTAEAPISANLTTDGYRYSINERGAGTFLDFYKVINGKVYGVFDEQDLGPFRMLAMDGRYLPYREASMSHCAGEHRLPD